jgi:hypothetical protein
VMAENGVGKVAAAAEAVALGGVDGIGDEAGVVVRGKRFRWREVGKAAGSDFADLALVWGEGVAWRSS